MHDKRVYVLSSLIHMSSFGDIYTINLVYVTTYAMYVLNCICMCIV